MRKVLILLPAALLLLLVGQVFGAGTTFNAVVKNDSLVAPARYFTINLYCTNHDSIFLDLPNRTFWTSPFSFNGNISIDWLDAALTNDLAYIDSVTITKFATVQFHNFWDFYKIIYVESWADGLPDRFSFAGIANDSGFPPALDSILILSWHAKTTNDSGHFCIEKGDMINGSYDWLFDTTYYAYPKPDFAMQCWEIDTDTLKVFDISVPVFDPIFDTIRVDENKTLTIPGTVNYELGGASIPGSAKIKATDPGKTLTLSYYPTLGSATFTDSGDGTGKFVYKPTYNDSGHYTINFVASNGIFADTETVVIHVMNMNAPPVLDNISSPKNIDEHKLLSFVITASDTDGDSVSFTMHDTEPPGATLTSASFSGGKWRATFSFTPTELQGGLHYNVNFEAADKPGGKDNQTVRINANEVNDPPVLAAIGAKSVAPGALLKFGVSATDPEGGTITLTTSTRPTGATFTDSLNGKGAFEWTPTTEQMGIDTVTFYASDGTKSDTERVTISVTLDVKEIHQSQLPVNFSLKQNYPNPFNPSTIIEFAVPTATHVNLSVFNLLGQKVVTLVDEDLQVGYKSVLWNGENETGNQIASGVYFYRMVAKDFKATKRLIMLK